MTAQDVALPWDDDSSTATTDESAPVATGPWLALPEAAQKVLTALGFTPQGFAKYIKAGGDDALAGIKRALKQEGVAGPDMDTALTAAVAEMTGDPIAPAETTTDGKKPNEYADSIDWEAEEDLRGDLVTYYLDHFGVAPDGKAIKVMSAVLRGDATQFDFESWASKQKGFIADEVDTRDISKLEQDKRSAYADIWGYAPPSGYMAQFKDMNPMEFMYYEMSKPEYQKTQHYRTQREELRTTKDEIFGTVRQDNNRFGAFDSTANWQEPRATGFMGMKPASETGPKQPPRRPGGSPPEAPDRNPPRPPKPPKKKGNKYANQTASGEPLDGEGPGR